MKRYNPLFVKGSQMNEFATSDPSSHAPLVLSASKYIVEILPNADICFAGAKLPFRLPKIKQAPRLTFEFVRLVRDVCIGVQGWGYRR